MLTETLTRACAGLAAWLAVMPPLTTVAAAQTGTPSQVSRKPALIVGGYGGQYECGNQAFGLSLKINRLTSSAIAGEALLPNRLVKRPGGGEFPWSPVKVKGEYDAAAKSFVLNPEKDLILLRDLGEKHITLRGEVEAENGYLVGSLDYPTCGTFVLVPESAGNTNVLAADYVARIKARHALAAAQQRTAAAQRAAAPAPDSPQAVQTPQRSAESARTAAAPTPVASVASSQTSSPTGPPSNSLQPVRADERPECVRNTAGSLFQDYATRKCVDALQSAAAAGDAAAMGQLGWRHIVRHPDDLAGYANPKLAPFGPANVLVTPDSNVALDWFRKAADRGNADAMTYLGWMYFEGLAVKQDDAEAARWMRRAADEGAPRAMAMLGLMQLTGRGVTRNEIEGENWVRRAAVAGDRRAMASLASILLAKEGQPKRPANWNQMNSAQQAEWLVQAVQAPGDDPVAWLRKGCIGSELWLTRASQRIPPGDLSDPFACYQLGVLYATGAAGVDKDLLAADFCFIGVSRGFGDRYSVGWYQVGNGRPESILRAAANARKEYRSFEAQLTKLKAGKKKEEDWPQVAALLLILFLLGTSQPPEPGSPEFTLQMMHLFMR
jgi:TPR repeat protein